LLSARSRPAIVEALLVPTSLPRQVIPVNCTGFVFSAAERVIPTSLLEVDLVKNKVHRYKVFCTKDLIERVGLVDLLTTPDACCAPARRAFPTGSATPRRPLNAVVLGCATTGSLAAGWLRSIRPSCKGRHVTPCAGRLIVGRPV
jgi:hypothetical protein